jgi:branched-chain amino acid transport system permease protein
MGYFIDLVVIGVSIGMIYGLVAIGISLIYSGLDIVHFAHGEVYMIGAFIGLTLFDKLAIGYEPTLILAVIMTGLVGVVIERQY